MTDILFIFITYIYLKNYKLMENQTYEIYYSWKMLLLSLACAAMGAIGIASAFDRQLTGPKKVILGISGIIMTVMVLVGLIDFSYSRIFKMPVLIIGDDRVKKHTPLQRGYTDIMFEDVDDFRLVSLKKINMIAIKYSPAGYRKLIDESNALNRALPDLISIVSVRKVG
jgi:hypothetical protein